MRVKSNGEISREHSLNGGGPQGTLIGQIEYLVNSNDNADSISPEDRYKYIDYLSVLELVMMTGLLKQLTICTFLHPLSKPRTHWTEYQHGQLRT